jgi:thioredoxin
MSSARSGGFNNEVVGEGEEHRMTAEGPNAYSGGEPTREALDRMQGPVVLEFGAEWCGHCQALRPQLAALLEKFPEIRHIRIEDGKGKPLGRSFRVKLWPTLVFMRNGQVVRQLARPNLEAVQEGLASIG